MFILDAFTDVFITICIILNTILLALDHHQMDSRLEKILANGNTVYF